MSLDASLDAALASRLDPIDWFTFKDHVYNLASSFTAASWVLLGGFTSLRPRIKPPESGAKVQSHANILNLGNVRPRVAYLPSSIPPGVRR